MEAARSNTKIMLQEICCIDCGKMIARAQIGVGHDLLDINDVGLFFTCKKCYFKEMDEVLDTMIKEAKQIPIESL